jgi:hypothetical protein
MPTQIAPSVGAGCLFTQSGVGAAPGYAAIDIRRGDGSFITQGIINTGAYLVSQRGAGANQTVDIAANAGTAVVAGTTIANQAPYQVPPHSAVINEAIAAADPTNPRIDQVILRCYDNTIDGSGQNKAQVEVLTGVASAGATLANRTGALALTANAMRLADVLVPAASASVTNANIKDRRPKTRGKSNIGTTESRTNVAYGTLTTPDQVTEIVLAADGRIRVAFQGTWQESVAQAASAAIFLNATQLQSATPAARGVQEAKINSPVTTAIDVPLCTASFGLVSANALAATNYPGDAATGQVVGIMGNGTQNAVWVFGGQVFTQPIGGGGVCEIFAAAGTYDVSVQFKSTSGSITAKNRKLWVEAMDPNVGVLA